MDEDVFRRDRARPSRDSRWCGPRAGDRRSRRRSPTHTRRSAARAARRGPRGRSRRRSPAWRAPDGRAGATVMRSCPAALADPAVTAPDGRRARTSAAGGNSRRRRANHPGNGSGGGGGRSAFELPEHVEVLLLDHRPRVVAREVVAAVLAQARMQRPVRFERIQRLGELLVALVVEPGVAADALTLEHVASAVGEDRPSERPGLERDHREALEVRGHDQQVGGGQRVELVLVGQIPEMVDAVVRRDRDDRLADEHEIQPARERHRVALEVVEELAAPLVGVDAPDVDRKRPVDLVPPPETRGIGSRRHLRAHADDDAGTCSLRVAFWIIARSSYELYMIPRTPLNIGPNIDRPMAGSRSAVGTRMALPGSRRAPCQA